MKMIKIADRLELIQRLGNYLLEDGHALEQARQLAWVRNPWFIPEFTHYAIRQICLQFLVPENLRSWMDDYPDADFGEKDRTLGIVMAGNIPLAGFHDFLCGFISGYRMRIKCASRDDVLLPHCIDQLERWDPSIGEQIMTTDLLKGCHAYIATGSNDSSRYFDYYFSGYPHIIRRNRSSAAILDGHESPEDLQGLADDIMRYFGLGCRNVTQVFVPPGYDFIPLLEALDRYRYLADHGRYRNNLDYQLALLTLNGIPYLSRPNLLVVKNPSLFSPVGVLHYEIYEDMDLLQARLKKQQEIQCLIGKGGIRFGTSQQPALDQYADGVDTLAFLTRPPS